MVSLPGAFRVGNLEVIFSTVLGDIKNEFLIEDELRDLMLFDTSMRSGPLLFTNCLAKVLARSSALSVGRKGHLGLSVGELIEVCLGVSCLTYIENCRLYRESKEIYPIRLGDGF